MLTTMIFFHLGQMSWFVRHLLLEREDTQVLLQKNRCIEGVIQKEGQLRSARYLAIGGAMQPLVCERHPWTALRRSIARKLMRGETVFLPGFYANGRASTLTPLSRLIVRMCGTTMVLIEVANIFRTTQSHPDP